MSLEIARPDGVPADLTRPSQQYRALVGVVLAALGLFIVFYVGLGALCLLQLQRFFSIVNAPSDDGLVIAALAAVPAVLLLILLVGGLFGISRMTDDPELLEVTPDGQPRLFAFVHSIADAVGAPRPKRVFLSREVNAAVAYDASVLNLVMPTQKNLIVGLGLVNALTLDELKAVLAHEFGHFSQRSMGLGSYVYVASQVIERVVHHRGWLDSLVGVVSRLDIRIAWLGWLGLAAMWAVRTVLELMLYVLHLPTRALTRAMELHADKVAVSLTGSDSLIRALYKLGFADQAMHEALGEVAERSRNDRYVADLFAHQTEAMRNLRLRAGDPRLGLPQDRPDVDPDSHRIFEDDDAPPPQMWATHPPNDVRERSAKSPYLASHLDDRTAWTVFDDPAAARHAVTRRFNTKAFGLDPAAELDADVAQGTGAIAWDPRYLGLYGAASVAGSAPTPADCSEDLSGLSDAELGDAAQSLYDDALESMIDARAQAITDLQRLLAVCTGQRTLPEGGLRFHGERLQASEIPTRAAAIRHTAVEAERALDGEMRRIRGVVAACAARLGPGRAAQHTTAVAWVHHTTHRAEDLDRIRTRFAGLVQGAMGTELDEREFHRFWDHVFDEWTLFRVWLESLEKLAGLPHSMLPGAAAPRAVVLPGELMPEPSMEDMDGHWLARFDAQLARAHAGMGDLCRAALDHLIGVENDVLEAWPDGGDADPDTLPKIPVFPPRVVDPGTGLASITIPQVALPSRPQRSWAGPLIAVSLLGLFVAAPVITGSYQLVLYNASDLAAEVTVDGAPYRVAPRSTQTLSLWLDREVDVEGRVGPLNLRPATIELAAAAERRGVVNLGQLGVLARYQVVWSESANVQPNREPEVLGNPLFVPAKAYYVLEEPPQVVSVRSGAVRRLVLADVRDQVPFDTLSAMLDEEALGELAVGMLATGPIGSASLPWQAVVPEARWDTVTAALRERAPESVYTHRALQIARGDDQALVPTYRQRAEASGTADDLYLWARLVAVPGEAIPVYERALEVDPSHGLAACGLAHTLAQDGQLEPSFDAVVRCGELLPRLRAQMLHLGLVMAHALGEPERYEQLLTGPEAPASSGLWQTLLAVEQDPGSVPPAEDLSEATAPMVLYIAGRDREALAAALADPQRYGRVAIYAAATLNEPETLASVLEQVPVGSGGAHAAFLARRSGHSSAAARAEALPKSEREVLDAVDLSADQMPKTWSFDQQMLGYQLAALAGNEAASEYARRLTLPGLGVRIP